RSARKDTGQGQAVADPPPGRADEKPLTLSGGSRPGDGSQPPGGVRAADFTRPHATDMVGRRPSVRRHGHGGTSPGRRQTTKCGPAGPEKESTGNGTRRHHAAAP